MYIFFSELIKLFSVSQQKFEVNKLVKDLDLQIDRNTSFIFFKINYSGFM